MKRICLLLVVLFSMTVFVHAQPGMMDPAEMVKRQVEQLTTSLSLTKDQVPKVETIVKKYNEKIMAMFEDMRDGGGDFSAMREKMTKVQEEQTKEMKTILTAEQGTQYDKFLEEQRERMRQMGGPGGPGR